MQQRLAKRHHRVRFCRQLRGPAVRNSGLVMPNEAGHSNVPAATLGPIGVVQIKTVTLTWVKRIQGPNPFAISYVNGKTVVTGLDSSH